MVARTLSGLLLVLMIVVGCSDDPAPGGADTTQGDGTEAQGPRLRVAPEGIALAGVAVGTRATEALTLHNDGDADLVVNGFSLSGAGGFDVTFPGVATYATSTESAVGIVLPEPLRIAPGAEAEVLVGFAATGTEPASGQLLLSSNDPRELFGTPVALAANVGGPCLSVTPARVDFAGRRIGTSATNDVILRSCGDVPLVVSDVALEGDASFAIATDGALTLAPNESATVKVTFTPAAVGLVEAALVVRSNFLVPALEVEVSGIGVEDECPTAVITLDGIEDGATVAPGTRLRLSGRDSTASAGAIAAYRWRATAPVGSVSTFLPSDSAADPMFELNVAGVYTFELTVTDQLGASCAPVTVTVNVVPVQALYVELTWRTPGDVDEGNEGAIVGSDLDLHLLHPLARTAAPDRPDRDGDGLPDGWFDSFFDCYWANERPNWGQLAPAVADDPVLLRDDTDGGGPESIGLAAPEDGACYTVGVSYWAANDLGAARATVRVYVHQNLVFELQDVELVEHDLWSVTSVCWPANELPAPSRVCAGTFDACTTSVDCGGAPCDLRITPDYCPDSPACPD